MGAAWYLNGKFEKKQNTFDDVRDCIVGLIRMGVTTEDKIALLSRSAGGLVAGYAINNFNISVVVSQVLLLWQ